MKRQVISSEYFCILTSDKQCEYFCIFNFILGFLDKPYIEKWVSSKPLLQVRVSCKQQSSGILLPDDCCLLETCNKRFELTHFYVWFRPALSYLWDIEHFCSKKKLTVYVILDRHRSNQ